METLDYYISKTDRWLIGIYIVQQFMRARNKYGELYNISLVINRPIEKYIEYLNHKNRDTSIRLIKYGLCIICGSKATDDHLIPTSRGGPNTPDNYLPLCLKHNISKGNKEFIKWFVTSGYKLSDIPEPIRYDAMAAVARLTYQYQFIIEPGYLKTFFEDAISLIPISEYRNKLLRYLFFG
jgi:hypothetical protein